MRHRGVAKAAVEPCPPRPCTATCRSQDEKRTCCILVLRRAVAFQLPAPETVRGVAPFPRTQARPRTVCRSVAALGHKGPGGAAEQAHPYLSILRMGRVETRNPLPYAPTPSVQP